MTVFNLRQNLTQGLKGELELDDQLQLLNNLQQTSLADFMQIYEALKLTQSESCPDDYTSAIDICGTGGSSLPRFNTSTVVSFVLAAAGVKIAKHGNYAAGGRAGSLDLLEALEINPLLTQPVNLELFNNDNLVFLPARHYFPALRHFAEARRLFGKPTVFNILGPLLSPANVKKQVIGTAFIEHIDLIARTCQLIGREKVYIVRGDDGLDEVTLTGETSLTIVTPTEINSKKISPEDFGILPSGFEEIRGGTAVENAQIAIGILENRCKTRHVDLVLINAALALHLIGKVPDLKAGYKFALEVLQSGKPLKVLEAFQQASKPSILLELASAAKKTFQKIINGQTFDQLKDAALQIQPTRNFAASLRSKAVPRIIAEIKFASPSSGDLLSPSVDPQGLAKSYQQNGAVAISCVTESSKFKGDLAFLKKIKAAVDLPILAKDFITEPEQVLAVRLAGADAILLIAALLTESQLADLIILAQEIGLHVLCEVHDERDLQKALASGATNIGINNRNLHNFQLDLKTTANLLPKIPKHCLVVSESGFSEPSELQNYIGQVNAFLIGTELVKSPDPGQKLSSLIQGCHVYNEKLLKICGVRSLEVAEFCNQLAIPFVGLNFVPTSRRYLADLELARKIRNQITNCRVVGVFMDQDPEFINRLVSELNLDYIQLSGSEPVSHLASFNRPIIKTLHLVNESDLEKVDQYAAHVDYLLIDSAQPGSGQQANLELLSKLKMPYILAGGINPDNATGFLQLPNLIGLDVASGVELELPTGERVIDNSKIQQLFNLVQNVT